MVSPRGLQNCCFAEGWPLHWPCPLPIQLVEREVREECSSGSGSLPEVGVCFNPCSEAPRSQDPSR